MKILAGILLLTFTVQSIAYTVSDKTIKKAHVNTGSGIYFQTNESMPNPDNCASAVWYQLDNSTYEKEAFSIILTAQATGNKVSLSLNGCVSGYPKVIWINTYK